ncbi:MAG TPA: DUF695 domain-containing protein [Candidatus Limnocylindrales bacterium]
MPFFKRDSATSKAPADFWTWWSSARDRIAQAIATGRFEPSLVEEIGRAVDAIRPGMAWELAPGHVARHAFCVSPEGNAELRQAALRWLAAAPPADETWEFHASKQPARQVGPIRIGNSEFDLGEMRSIATWDATHRRVDVRLWHPRFPDAAPAVRLQVGFVFLDKLLGEDDVERWIGGIELLDGGPAGLTPAELKAEVERRANEPAAESEWVVGQLTRPDGSVGVASVNAALKRIDHPFLDYHVTVTVVLGVDRLPNGTEAATLNAEEDDLLARLGSVALFVGRVTTPGERTMHFIAEVPDQMRPAIDGWAAALPDSIAPGLPARRIKVNFNRDPTWSSLKAIGIG